MVQRGGTERGRSPPKPLLAVPNVTAHPSTANESTIVMFHGQLVRGFKDLNDENTTNSVRLAHDLLSNETRFEKDGANSSLLLILETSSMAAGFGRHGMPPPASNPDL